MRPPEIASSAPAKPIHTETHPPPSDRNPRHQTPFPVRAVGEE
jgi:hypothetical protein